MTFGEHRKELAGGFLDTTNNRMEILAVVVALENLKRPCEPVIYSDSKYVVNALTQGWIENWQAKGWKTSAKQPVKNIDLWKRLLVAAEPHKVHYRWVKGHNGHPLNDRADELAVEARLDEGALVEDGGYEP